MPILTIRKWYGRLGNNIVQVMNTILIALYYKNFNIEIPSRDFFNKTLLTINTSVSFNEYKELEYNEFFYQDHTIFSHSWINSECFKTNITEMLDIIRDLFVFKYKELESFCENDLTIHIRSGDIFQGDGVNWNYIVPPLSYYTNIIESGNYNNIYLLCEDRINPCVNKLLELYPRIKFSINDIVDDIKIIMRSTNVVCSYGSFVPVLLNFTDYTKRMYIPSYVNELHMLLFNKNVDVVRVDLDHYKDSIGAWHNTDEQKELILTYS